RQEASLAAVLDHLVGVESDVVGAVRRGGLDAAVLAAVRGLDPVDLEALLVEHGVERVAVDAVVARFVRVQVEGVIPSEVTATAYDFADYLVHVPAVAGPEVGQARQL